MKPNKLTTTTHLINIITILYMLNDHLEQIIQIGKMKS